MGNLWIIVEKNPFAPSNIFDLRDFTPLYFHHKQRIQPGNYLLCRLHVLLLVENWTAQEATNFCASLYNENYWEEVQVVHFHAFIDNFMINIYKLICGYWLWVHVQLYVTHFKRKDYGELLEIYEILQSVSKQVLERAGHIKKGPLGCIATVT